MVKSFHRKLNKQYYQSIDSLEKTLSELKAYFEENNSAEAKVLYYDYVAKKYSIVMSDYKNDLDSLVHFNTKAIEIGKANQVDVSKQLYFVAYEHMVICETEKALNFAKELLTYSLENKALEGKAMFNTIQANIYSYCLNQNDSSIKYFNENVAYYRSIKDSTRLSFTLENVGMTYIELEEYETSLIYLNEALKIAEIRNSKESIIFCKSQIASAENNLGNFDIAEQYLKECMAYYKESTQIHRYGESAHLLGLLYLKKGELDKAEANFDIAINSISIKENAPAAIKFRIAKSKVLLEKKEYEKSIGTIKEALEINKTTQILNREANLYELLYQCQSKLGRDNNALVSLQHYMVLKDSLNSEKQKVNIKEIEEKYENVKKEAEISSLKSQSILDNQQKKSQRNLLIGLITITSLIGLFFFFLFRNRQKTAVKLQEIDTVKTRFFENISHEFRTPLTLIKLPVSNALKNNGNLTDKHLNIIHNNTSRLQNLIEDLLSLSELDAGKMKVKKTTQQPLKQISTLCSQFDSYAESKGVTYVKSIGKSHIEANYDKSVVEKVITNLISNAIKYSNAGDGVEVKVFKQNNDLIIEVSDTGNGISEENQKKIFDRFYQIDGKDESRQGSGIGLALIKKVLELNEGSISIKSELTKGSTFTASLPLENINYIDSELEEISKPDPALGDITKEKETELDVSNKPILLITEDNQELLDYIKDLFEKDYTIHTAMNGKEGIDKALEIVPDFIISDWMMPKMNGIDFCHELKSNSITSHIPFLLLTAKADVEDKIKGYQTGADAYFSKPFNFEELKAQIKNLIGQRKVLLEKFSDSDFSIHPQEKNYSSHDIKFWNEFKSYIKSNLSDSELSTNQIAEAMTMSRMQLHRKVTALTDQSVGAYIHKKRMQAAKILLKNKDVRISDVAFEVGFANASSFSTSFKKEFGISPTEFKDQK